nr:MAG TPA: hypothetical protein [Caudoviricetes sp.]
MTIKGWIGAVSGLPSLLVDGPCTVTVGDRVLARLGAGQHLVADALVAPGVETTYRAGGNSVSLTRPVGDWFGVYVAGRDGRSFPGLIYVSNEDPVEWSAKTTRVGGVTRWAVKDEPETGTGVIACEPAYEPFLWWILQGHHPVMLIPSAPTAGVPPRTVIVTGVSRKRLHDDLIELTVKWMAHEPHFENGQQGAVPVTTWGEWRAWGESHPGEDGWRAWSAIEVARRVQGMP